MSPFIIDVAALAAIYYIWRLYAMWLSRRQHKLRERVAYMLWVAAQRVR